jgi:anti-sigma B factor antagonist
VSAVGTSALWDQPPYLPGPGGAPLGALQVDIRRHTAGRVVVLIGELDIATVPTLTNRLAQSAGTARSRLVADLSGLRFCDCAGLGTLVGIHRDALEHGGWLRLYAPAARMRKLLQITRLSQVLLSYPNIEAAFAESSDADRLQRIPASPRRLSG